MEMTLMQWMLAGVLALVGVLQIVILLRNAQSSGAAFDIDTPLDELKQ